MLALTLIDTPSAAGAPINQIQETSGWDRCGYISPSELQYVWNNTRSYQGNLARTYGVYVGGPNLLNCFVANPTWMAQANSLVPGGWGFAPIWVGRQMPKKCQVGTKVGYNEYVDLTGGAFSEGESDGAAAATDAANAGFAAANIIYLDLEGYNSGDSSCTNAANAYISGWVYDLEYLQSWYAGVYGSLGSTIDALTAAIGQPGQYVPYVVWPAACGNGTNDSSSCDTNVWNLQGLPNSDWTYDQRLYQWDRDRTIFVGDQTFNQPNGMDADCVDGIADGGLAESVWDPGTINGGEYYEINSPADDTLC